MQEQQYVYSKMHNLSVRVGNMYTQRQDQPPPAQTLKICPRAVSGSALEWSTRLPVLLLHGRIAL